jgi:hypothetical protein
MEAQMTSDDRYTDPLQPGAPPLPPPGPETKPPSLHWLITLLLALVTFGIFGLVWMFVQARWVKKIDPGSKAMIILAISTPIFLCLAVIGVPQVLVRLPWAIALLVAYFDMRAAIEVRYRIKLSGLMTFFFNVVYFQYHFRKLARNEYEVDTGRMLA